MEMSFKHHKLYTKMLKAIIERAKLKAMEYVTPFMDYSPKN